MPCARRVSETGQPEIHRRDHGDCSAVVEREAPGFLAQSHCAGVSMVHGRSRNRNPRSIIIFHRKTLSGETGKRDKHDIQSDDSFLSVEYRGPCAEAGGFRFGGYNLPHAISGSSSLTIAARRPSGIGAFSPVSFTTMTKSWVELLQHPSASQVA